MVITGHGAGCIRECQDPGGILDQLVTETKRGKPRERSRKARERAVFCHVETGFRGITRRWLCGHPTQQNRSGGPAVGDSQVQKS